MINEVEVEQAVGDERTAVRVEHVGSLMKPPALQEAYRGYLAGAVVLDALRVEQDAAVASVLAEQEARGIPLLTDGELRRAVGVPPGNPGPAPRSGPPESPALDEYRFARSLTRRVVDCGTRTGYRWLRFVPPDKTVVLGLVSTRRGTFETVDSLTSSVEEASRYLPVEQLAIGPRCGFAALDGVESVTADEQWRKLDTLLRTAQRIWGFAP